MSWDPDDLDLARVEAVEERGGGPVGGREAGEGRGGAGGARILAVERFRTEQVPQRHPVRLLHRGRPAGHRGLLDRLEVIEFPGYIEEEKLIIAERYLLPRQIEETGMEEIALRFAADAMKKIIREYTFEAGVRNFEREISKVCRKVARWKAEGKQYPSIVTPNMIEKFLGPQQFFQTEAERRKMKWAWRPA